MGKAALPGSTNAADQTHNGCSLTTGTSVQITGEWKKSAKGTKQTRELVADGIRILGGADPEVRGARL